MKCRHCNTPLTHVFLDLGMSPPSNAYLTAAELTAPEPHYPLKIYVCDACWLVQTQDFTRAEHLFDQNYAYFSSISHSWLDHAQRYCSMITERLGLNDNSQVVEVASNDGYLLKNFVAAGIPCLGIEPTASTADAAEKLGIPVVREFFGTALAETLCARNQQADLIIGNNVYAHVPDINGFTHGLKILLKPGGVITLEFPHFLQLLEQRQFDTVYHEHFSYLSLSAVQRIFTAAGLRVWDVEPLSTHGGSLRVYGCHAGDPRVVTPAVAHILQQELNAGLEKAETYRHFQLAAEEIRDAFHAFLMQQKTSGKTVAAYGAAAKGNTLLNFAGITADLIPFVCDAAPSKQGKFLPGSHIPVLPPAALAAKKPDYVVILPWNIAAEVITQHGYIREWGGQFVTAIPHLRYW